MCERLFQANNRLYCLSRFTLQISIPGFEVKAFITLSVWSANTSKKVHLVVISIEPIWLDLSPTISLNIPKNLGYLYHAVRQYSALNECVFGFGNVLFRFCVVFFLTANFVQVFRIVVLSCKAVKFQRNKSFQNLFFAQIFQLCHDLIHVRLNLILIYFIHHPSIK